MDIWKRSGRRNPATGVLISRDRPTIVFLTVCTLHRAEHSHSKSTMMLSCKRGLRLTHGWSVRTYHARSYHLFCAPKNEEIAIEHWIAFWKRQFRRKSATAPRFQSRGFHHRFRRDENYHRNGSTCEAIPSGRGSLRTLKNGSIKVC